MINANVSLKWNPDALKKVIQGAPEKVTKRLAAAGLTDVTASLVNVDGKLQVKLQGPPDQLEKANELLKKD